MMGVYTMSLWDKDKATDNRGIPSPQSKDENKARMAHGTTAFTLKQEDTDSELGKLVFKDGKLSLIKPDGAVVNITGDGMKVAQPGFDATTTDDANLVLSSEYNSFKIIEKGTIPVSYSNTVNLPPTFSYGSTILWSYTIPHNLAYPPLVYLTMPTGGLDDIGQVANGTVVSQALSPYHNFIVTVSIDTTAVRTRILITLNYTLENAWGGNVTTADSFNIGYRVLVETAN